MFPKPTVVCPVCDEKLGYLVKGEVCSFVCRECQWIFTWDGKGKLGKPIQVNGKKPQVCGCGGCQARDEKKFFKGR